VGIATGVAVTMFQDPVERSQAVSVPLFYGLVEAIVVGIYCVCAWKAGWTKAPADENICVVVSKTYEVEDAAHVDDCDESTSNTMVGHKDDSSGKALEAAECGTVEKHKGKGVCANRSRLVSEDNTATTCSTISTLASPQGTTPASSSSIGGRTRSLSASPVNRDLLHSFDGSVDSMEAIPRTVLTTHDEVPTFIDSGDHEDLTETHFDEDDDDANV